MKGIGLVWVLVGVFTIGATCDRVINPFEDEFGSYSIYGALDQGKSQNFVRIKNLTTPLLSDSTIGYEGVSVSFTDYQTNITTSLEDSIIDYNGNFTRNFQIDTRLEPASAYNVTLNYSPTESISSDIFTPGVTMESTSVDTVSGCFRDVNIRFGNVKEPEFIIAEIGVVYQDREYWSQIQTIQEPTYIEGEDAMDMDLTVNNLLIESFMPPPEATIGIPPRFWMPTIECEDLSDYTMRIRYIHFGTNWEQFYGKSFTDLDFIDFNSDGFGLGFIGAIRRGEFEFVFDPNKIGD